MLVRQETIYKKAQKTSIRTKLAFQQSQSRRQPSTWQLSLKSRKQPMLRGNLSSWQSPTAMKFTTRYVRSYTSGYSSESRCSPSTPHICPSTTLQQNMHRRHFLTSRTAASTRILRSPTCFPSQILVSKFRSLHPVWAPRSQGSNSRN